MLEGCSQDRNGHVQHQKAGGIGNTQHLLTRRNLPWVKDDFPRPHKTSLGLMVASILGVNRCSSNLLLHDAASIWMRGAWLPRGFIDMAKIIGF